MKTGEIVDLDRLRRLAGITGEEKKADTGADSPLTYGGSQRAQYARAHDIQPGTDEWFRLWFARQRLTGEDPMPR